MIRRLRASVARLRAQERLLLITVTTVLVMSGQGVIAPVLPLFADSLGASVASVGLTLSAFAAARLLLNVPLGLAADRYGRRFLLVLGPLVTGAGMVGSGFATGIPDLLAWRFLAGAGSAMYMTGAQIYLADISTVENRARYIGTNQGALLFGVTIGPGVGGLLAEAYGFRVPFFAVGVAAALASAYAWARLPETRPSATEPTPAPGALSEDGDGVPDRPWLVMLRSRDFAAVSLVTGAIFLTRAGGRMTLMPLLAAGTFGYTAGTLGTLFMVMALINLVGIAPAAWITDRFGRKWAIVPSGFVIAAAFLGMIAADTNAWFIGAALVLSIGTSTIGPAPAAYAADIAPPAFRGLAMGLYRSAGDVGFTFGPVLLGALADATSLAWALGANAAIVVSTSAFFAVAARETSPPPMRAPLPHAAPIDPPRSLTG